MENTEEVLSETDKQIVKALQEDFPLCEEPYKVLAERVGMDENEFLQRVKVLMAERKIRKMGAVLRHREVGFKANALCAWNVPPEKLDEIAATMIKNPAVSHCYDRTIAPNWNYNLYTMVHAKTREECDSTIEELAKTSGVKDYRVLYSKKEWKKTGMKYFTENVRDL